MSDNVYDQLYKDFNIDLVESVAMNTIAAIDLTQMVLGDHIGRGAYRTVFEFPLNEDWIIKYEHNMQSNNAIEYDIWETVSNKGKKYSKWFAPCIAISGCTKFLIMRRTSPVLTWPKKIPKMLSDKHIGNFGMLDGKFVCHDYGATKILRDKCDLLKLKKAKWRT